MLTKLQITNSAEGHATVQNSQGGIVNMLPGGLEVDNISPELLLFCFSGFVGAILVGVVLTATEEFSATVTEKNRIRNYCKLS